MDADEDFGDDDVGDDDVGDDDTGDDDVSEDPWCWTVAPAGGQLAVLQMDAAAGTWFEYGRYGQGVNESFHTSGLARKDDTLVMAAYLGNNFQWAELDMAADVFTAGSGTDTVSTAMHGKNIATLCNEGLCLYDDFAALDAGVPVDISPVEYYASRLGIHGDTLYTAWHSTAEIDVYDVITATYQHTLQLEDYDTWVRGISQVHDLLYVLDDGRGAHADQGQRIAVFDASTGLLDHDMFFDVSPGGYSHVPTGLWCE